MMSSDNQSIDLFKYILNVNQEISIIITIKDILLSDQAKSAKAYICYDDICVCIENTEGAINNGQSRETGSIEYTRRDKQTKNTTQYVLDTTIRKQTQIT